LLGPRQRDRFEALAAVLIPGLDDRLSPVRLALGGDRLDDVLHARPDLYLPLRRVLAAGSGDAAQQIEALQTGDPEAFTVLATVVTGAYYLEPAVRAEIGYPGQEAIVTRPDSYPDYIGEGLLDHMLTGDVDAQDHSST